MTEKTTKQPLAGIVFDMDGLMYDTERIIMEAWNKTGEEMGYGPLGFHIFHTLGMSRTGRKEYFLRELGEDFPYDEFQERYAAETYRRTASSVPIKAGLYELLDFLKKEGYLTAVATSSSRESAHRKLKSSHLENYFDVLVCGDMVKKAKPDPEIYTIACEKLKNPPELLLALEDSKNGLKSALAAGMKAIMIPDLIKDCPEVEPYLEAKLDRLDKVIPFLQEHFECII